MPRKEPRPHCIPISVCRLPTFKKAGENFKLFEFRALNPDVHYLHVFLTQLTVFLHVLITFNIHYG